MRELYAGIDLHANNNYLCIIIESLPGQTLFVGIDAHKKTFASIPRTSTPHFARDGVRLAYLISLNTSMVTVKN